MSYASQQRTTLCSFELYALPGCRALWVPELVFWSACGWDQDPGFPGAGAYPLVGKAGPGATASPLVGKAGSQGFWLQGPGGPRIGVLACLWAHGVLGTVPTHWWVRLVPGLLLAYWWAESGPRSLGAGPWKSCG